ncbi:ATP-binding cassette domain-containing protein [Teichococcus aestuarii]|uniref:ATP-binding cassette domain-containing protein n=1 Tax=Teichococcus aestuarii TaxID=568898 RepID=UPI00360F7F84
MDSNTVPLLDVRDLTVEFATRRGTVRAVKRVNLSIGRGETLGVVGESGSGKSVTSYAVMRILERTGRIAEGSIAFSGVPLRELPEREMRDLRGREISMIFQNPRAALNPIRPVGQQIADVLRRHGRRRAPMRGPRPSPRWSRCASPAPPSGTTPIPSSCRAACASAWSSRSPSPAARAC